jgi:hypothetical protein
VAGPRAGLLIVARPGNHVHVGTILQVCPRKCTAFTLGIDRAIVFQYLDFRPVKLLAKILRRKMESKKTGISLLSFRPGSRNPVLSAFSINTVFGTKALSVGLFMTQLIYLDSRLRGKDI